MKQVIKKSGFVLISIQLITTFKQSLSLIVRKRSFLRAYYWFLVRSYVSLFGNRAGLTHLHNSNLTLQLRDEGFMELDKLSEKTVESLVEYFLESQQQQYISLQDYFDKQRVNNFVRSEAIDIVINDDLCKSVLAELKILPIISEFLGLPENKILISAKVDALFKINGERELRNNHDDALEFHRDIDSLRFVKAFVYLVDIDKGFGEHEVCIGSHKSLPFVLSTIQRQECSNLKSNLPHFSLKSIVGKAGYAWIEDTTTFHRGTIPTLGDRLILILSFNDKKSATHLCDTRYHPLDLLLSSNE